MSYATISTWKGQRSPDDDMIATLNSKFAPALKAMGVTKTLSSLGLAWCWRWRLPRVMPLVSLRPPKQVVARRRV